MIRGKTLNLRLFRDEKDVLEQYSMYNELNERALTDHTEVYPPNRQIASFQETGFWTKDYRSLVITTKDDEILGTVSFHRKTELELSIGYRIYQSKQRRKGVMTEVLRLFSAYLFETVPFITRLMIATAENNTASRKLAEKCGYKQEGILRQAYFYRGTICNWVIYSLLREESEDMSNAGQ